MEKEFISYDEAMNLRAIGFDIPCISYYYIIGAPDEPYPPVLYLNEADELPIDYNNFGCGDIVSAPTFSQCFRWFREKHKLHSTITSISQESWQWHITKPGESLGKLYDEDFYTYEEAELACLNKLIELIKTK